jgi:flagellar assembly protein FliH
MAAPAKFLFDTDFAAPDRARERATQAEVAQKVAEAEARAYRSGYDAALREAKVESDRRSAQALQEIGNAINGIAARYSTIESRMETEAVDVAVAVARKLATELIAREPLGEISALVADCFAQLVSTPHLVVRINGAHPHRSARQAERLFRPSHYPGRAGHPDRRLPDRMGRRRRRSRTRGHRSQDQRTCRALHRVPQPGLNGPREE